ncbi:ATP-dependent zinc metalloprotease YME1L1 [Triplophysa tibetana]|uniref:ATP-dependent zinc metalloprotease YME1L1 n=1 Tax=Triplophysa tibetana TaxID=1572043 RepID=A0A5A9N686_9TELE|nr:ATP-dependent zinc metalloprotease YME1L1 [Triplophysa tibetana]
MFSLPTTFQSQGTVPLTHLINVIQYLKSSANSAISTSVQSLQRDLPSEHDLLHNEPKVNLEDLCLSKLRSNHVDDVLRRLMPSLDLEEKTLRSAVQTYTAWTTSHVSAPSFFQNKHVWVQNRGFKIMRTKTRHQQSEDPIESENYTPVFMKGLLTKDTQSVESLEQIMRNKNLPESHQDTFKTGFTEGFMKAQALTQRTQVGFRTTSRLDSAMDPVQMKNITFEHVKGVDEAKKELQDVVEFLRNPQKFTVLGGKLPKGILLVGPPGTGKTLLAKAVAGEADVPFYYASGSEFDEMFVGVGASRIRNIFKEAKASAPCVVFIDELDSVGGKRIDSPMHPFSRQTVNQLLAEMDGFKPNEGVIVIGATNFAEALDTALVRPGRFDMQVTVPIPDVRGRTEILQWYLKKITVDSALDPEIIARGTVGFSGAELENLVNQAALKAAVDGKKHVTMKELEFAKDKILMGPERRSVEIDQKNKQITAYHESGHAIVAYYTKHAMPINKATIMPRGPSLGHVSFLPENDRWRETQAQLKAQMDVSMGGRVAEELIFGNDNVTTGASSDFDGATKIAQMMVTRFGMSDKLGVMTYSDLTTYSPETRAAVEREVRVLLQDAYERATKLLKIYSKEHKLLADALLTYETLDAKEIQMILEGKTLR